LGGGRYLLCPWLGTAGLETLARLLATHGPEAGWQLEAQANPYTLEVSFDGRADELLPALHDLIHHPQHTAATLLPPDEPAPQLAKFDEFIPPELLRQTYLHDILNLAEVRAIPFQR
jgi:ATP-dependent Lhr-like helicase